MRLWGRKKLPQALPHWQVTRPLSRLHQPEGGGEKYLRNLWVSRRGGLGRVALLGLAGWGAWGLIGSGHGILAIRAMAREEAGLKLALAEKMEENLQVQHQLHESPVTELERGVREKYLMSRKGEIVYHLRRTSTGAADSSVVDGESGSATEASAPSVSDDTAPKGSENNPEKR